MLKSCSAALSFRLHLNVKSSVSLGSSEASVPVVPGVWHLTSWRATGTILLLHPPAPRGLSPWLPGPLRSFWWVFLLCQAACAHVWWDPGKSSQPWEQWGSDKCLFSSLLLLNNACLFFLVFLTPCWLPMSWCPLRQNTTQEWDACEFSLQSSQ